MSSLSKAVLCETNLSIERSPFIPLQESNVRVPGRFPQHMVEGRRKWTEGSEGMVAPGLHTGHSGRTKEAEAFQCCSVEFEHPGEGLSKPRPAPVQPATRPTGLTVLPLTSPGGSSLRTPGHRKCLISASKRQIFRAKNMPLLLRTRAETG